MSWLTVRGAQALRLCAWNRAAIHSSIRTSGVSPTSSIQTRIASRSRLTVDTALAPRAHSRYPASTNCRSVNVRSTAGSPCRVSSSVTHRAYMRFDSPLFGCILRLNRRPPTEWLPYQHFLFDL